MAEITPRQFFADSQRVLAETIGQNTYRDRMTARLQRKRYERALIVSEANAVSPALGMKARSILRAYPGLSPEGFVGMMELRDDPDSEVLARIAALDADVTRADYAVLRSDSGSPNANMAAGGAATADGFNPMNLLRTGVRSVLDIAEAPLRAVQGGVRSAYGEVSEEGDWGGAFKQVAGILPPVAAALELTGQYEDRPNPWEQTTFGQSVYSALGVPEEGGTLADPRIGEVEPLFFSQAQGSGWFVDPESEIASRQRRAAMTSAPPTAGGEGWTLGRGLTDAVGWDPDSTRYRLVSGLVDAASVLALDPLVFAGGVGAVGKARSATALAGRRSEAAVAARGVVAERAAEQARVATEPSLRAQRYLAEAREGRARYVELPELNAELSRRRDELRALSILADARHGQAKYGGIDAAGRLNDTRVADLDARIAENLDAERRLKESMALLTSEVKVAERGLRFEVSPRPPAEEQWTARLVADQIEADVLDRVPAAQRRQFLVDRFNEGIDPEEVKAAFQADGTWRNRNQMWNSAVRAYDRDAAAAARGTAARTEQATREAMEAVEPGVVANALQDLSNAVDLPGTVLHTPRNMPYTRIPADRSPFGSTDDVWTGLVDGEPALVRLPQIAQGQQVRTAERVARGPAEPAVATHGIVPMSGPNSVRFRPGEKPKRDVTLAEAREIAARVGRGYDADGNPVDITGFQIGELDRTGKMRGRTPLEKGSGSATLDEFLSATTEQVSATPLAPTPQPRSVRVSPVFEDMSALGVYRAKPVRGEVRPGLEQLNVGDTVRVGNGRSSWTVTYVSRKGHRVKVRSEKGQERVLNRDKVSRDATELNYEALPYLEGTEDDVARLVDEIGDTGVGRLDDGGLIDEVPVDGYRVQVLDADGNVVRTTYLRRGETYEPSQQVTTVRGVVDGTAPPDGPVWRDIVETLPPAMNDPKGRPVLARLAQANGGPIPWTDVVDVARRYDVLAELSTVMLRNGVLGISRLGRTRSQTWVPETLGASVVPVVKARRGEDLVPPPDLVQNRFRQGLYAKRLRQVADDTARTRQERDALVQANKANQRRTRELWKAVDADRQAIRDKAREVLAARRDLTTARLTADEAQALADETAQAILDVAVPRSIDGSRVLDVKGLAALIDPKRGALARPTGTAVDRLMRRVGAEGMVARLATIDNVGTLNRLFKGRLDRDQLLQLADAKTGDEVSLLIQSWLDVVPDQIDALARSSRRMYVDHRGGSFGDRIARSLEIVSVRNPAIDLDRPHESAIALNQWLRTIGMDQGWVDERVDAFIRAPSPVERANILISQVGDGVSEHLMRVSGATPESEVGQAIQQYTRIFGDRFRSVNGWYVERHASGGHMNGMLVDGEFVEFGDSPHLLTELADSVVRLPDVTELRRLNTVMGRRLVTSKDNKSALETVADWSNAINDTWRTWLLIRGAYVVRNIAETQMRTYLMGSHNAFTNPLMFLAMMTSTSTSRTARALRPAVEKFDRYNRLSPALDMDHFTTDVLDPGDLTLSGEYANAAAAAYAENVLAGVAPQDFRAVSAALSTHKPVLVRRGEARFNEAHARELLVLRSDPLARIVAGDYPADVRRAIERGTDVEDAILSWAFSSDEGKEILRRFHETAKGLVRDRSVWQNRDWVRGYLFDWPASVRQRLTDATAGDETLAAFVASGSLQGADGTVLYKVDPLRRQAEIAKMSRAERLAERSKQQTRAGESEEGLLSKAVTQVFDRANLGDEVEFTAFVPERSAARIDRQVADAFFTWSGRVERLAAWNPEFRSAFIRHSLRYLDSMHPQDAIDWLDAVTPHMPKVRALRDMPGTRLVGGRADFSDLYARQRQRLKEVGGKGESSEAFLSTSDLESIAGAVASRHNQDLFYAALNQSNFWHAARFAIPFGQPTVNAYRVFGRSALDWTRVTTRHWPAVKAFQGAQSEGSSVINEAVAMLEPGSDLAYTSFDENDMPVHNRPFLYREGEGEPLRFRYPLLGSLMGGVADMLLPGDPGLSQQEMTGYVSGLNLALQGVQPVPDGGAGEQVGFIAANLLPSVGWTMQTVASWTPIDEQYGGAWDLANRWLFPFGRPDDDQSEAMVNLLPTWAKRGLLGALGNGETAARWRATNMKGVMGWHASRDTGTDWTTPAGKEDLLARSDRDARLLTFLQAIGAFFLPTAPTWTYEAIDEDGSAYAQVFLADEFRQIREKAPDWDAAVAEFMDRHGEGVALVPGVTSSTAGDPTLSAQAWEALNRNGELRAYRQVLPFFFPGDISWTAYEWQRQQGYRASLSPQERIEEAHRLVFEMQDAALTRRADEQGWADQRLEAEREVLRDRWPTGRPKGSRQYMTSEEKLSLVSDAMAEVPELATSPIGEATAEALERLAFWTEVGGNKTLTGKTVSQERVEFQAELGRIFGPVPGGDEMRRLFIAVTRER